MTETKDYKTKKAKIVPLFPGYIFVAFSLLTNWRAIRSTKGIKDLVQLEPLKPTRVPMQEIDKLLRLTIQSPYNPYYTIPRYTKIIVKKGSQKDLVGLCEYSTQEKVGLIKSLLGNEVVFEIPRDNIFVLDTK